MKRRAITGNGLVPVAQYIRMSTEHQRFSPDNQRAVNMAFAAEHGYEIVATYQDSGKSGLTLKRRPELKRLLSDVLGGEMPYRAILVLDVSRWGRFQDADQAAHYEYMCREAGVPVRYCSEAFDNDGGAMASIVKHMKRVMAAEYSRELSKRIARAQRHQAGLGYKQGGHAVFGVRRLVIDENGKPRMLLEVGQRKALSTDKVVFVKGSSSEVALVRRMFRMFALEGKEISEICRWLDKNKKAQRSGRPWNYDTVQHILRNEIYVGTYVFGRRSNNLGKNTPNPRDQWIRTWVMDPIVPADQFDAAAARFALAPRRDWTRDEIKLGLARLLREQGYISGPTINASSFLPNQYCVTRRWGTLANACREVGYEKPVRASKHQTRCYTDDELLEELRRIHRERGRVSYTTIDEDASTPKGTYFCRRLGGLRNAYFLAGIKQGRLPRQRADRTPDGRAMTDDMLLDGLRRLVAENGYVNSKLIAQDPRIPSSDFYGRKFGGLTRAYELIGYCTSRGDLLKAAFARSREAKRQASPPPITAV